MLFKAELAEKIVQGKKTQTRRPVKPGERLETVDGLLTVMRGHRLRMQQGRCYSVQYGRGKAMRWWHYEDAEKMVPALMPYDLYQLNRRVLGARWLDGFEVGGYRPLQIMLTDIRSEDVRDISYEDSIAEGFNTCIEFLQTWAGFYDAGAVSILANDGWSDAQKHVLISDRPDHLYQAWAYTFEIAEVG